MVGRERLRLYLYEIIETDLAQKDMEQVRVKEATARALAFLRRNPVWVLLFLIFVLYFVTRLLYLRVLPMFCDEATYIRWSQQALHEGKLLVSLSDGKTPLHPLMMVPLIAVFKDPLIAGRLTSVLFGALTMSGMVLLGKEFRDLKLGAWAALFYAICPYCLWYDRLAITQSMFLALFVLSIYFAVRAAKTANYYYLIGTGVTTGLALLTKGTALLLFITVPFAYLLRETRQKGMERLRPLARWLVAVALSSLLGYAMYSVLRFSPDFYRAGSLNPRWTLTPSQLLADPFQLLFRNLESIFNNLILFLTPALFIACFVGLLLGIYRKWRPAYFLGIWFLIPCTVVAFITRFPYPRYSIVFLPPLLFGAAYLLYELFELLEKVGEQKKRWLLTAITVLVLLVAFSSPIGMQISRILYDPTNASLSPEIRSQYLENWPAGWGIDEIVDFLEKESRNQKVVVGVMGPVGTHLDFPKEALEDYLFDNPNVEIVSALVEDAESFPEELEEAALEGPTYYVINGVERPPRGWPVEVLLAFPKNGNTRMFMFLTRVVPGS